MASDQRRDGEHSEGVFGRLRGLFGGSASDSHNENETSKPLRVTHRVSARQPALVTGSVLPADRADTVIDLRDPSAADPSDVKSLIRSLGVDPKAPTGGGRYDHLAPEAAAEKIFNDIRQGVVEAIDEGLLYYGKRPEIEPRGFILAAEQVNTSYWYAVSAAYNRQALRGEGK